MKKIFALILLLVIITTAQAQLSFSCTYREYCDWDNKTETFINCDGYDESSLFVINDSETMFVHTTPTMKSTYYIQEKEYDEAKKQLIYYVISDVGNEYLYIFDALSREIRVLITNDDEIHLLVFTVKAIF